MDYCIYVLSFNHPDLTERCVISCLGFTKQIVLIHNGSEPKHISHLRLRLPQVEHLEIKNNKGFTGGVNQAVSDFLNRKKEKWMLFITNDCELLEVNELPHTPGLYAPLIFKRKTDQIDSLGGGVDLKNLSLFHIKSRIENIENFENYYVPGTSWLMDRESLQKAPPFLEELGTYWEDVLFSFECSRRKIHLGQHPKIRLRHGIGKTCHKDPHYTSYLYRRNRWWDLTRIFKLSLWQKSQLAFQDLSFCARLVLKGNLSKAKLAFQALVHGNLSH